MRVRRAVITAAGPRHRTLPLQLLIDRDGIEKSVLAILVEEVVRAQVEEICLVVCPGDEAACLKVAGDHAGRLTFVHQDQPLGYGHAVYCARHFVKQEPFMHLVGDHLPVSRGTPGCVQRLVEVAQAEVCSVSAVTATRESLLPWFGAVGGQLVHGRHGWYRIDTVIEKPTPTEAEQKLIVPGLRAGHYLCFYGAHVFTPTVMELLGRLIGAGTPRDASLSSALHELAAREKYLALETADGRFDLGARYGLLTAQLALALSGRDRDEVLSQLVLLLARGEPDRLAG
ncbi:MAG: UTP--glucose-1-phosphate uridylyltransferase [Acidobacteria bacterium]|nr:UTP--glucose-1-phosphate uridylyltransferase [Acidobacteriota bacterium]